MSEKIKQPYVGVSGIVSPEIQTALEAASGSLGLRSRGRVLAMGVKATHKTQFLDVENKYGPEWYPVGADAFRHALRHDNPNPQTIAVAQVYLDPEYVDNQTYREKLLQRIIERGKPWLQAVQFDMLPWHENGEMWDFLERVKQENVEVFLQAHRAAMETLGPKRTVRLLGHYAHLIDYVLFDASHGTGARLDVPALMPFIDEAHDALDLSQTGIAIAGGLSGKVVREDLPQLVDKYPNLSWDAEGQLHPMNPHGKRPLDLPAARDYLRASSDILKATVGSGSKEQQAILDASIYWGIDPGTLPNCEP